MIRPSVSLHDVERLAQHGSPALLQAFGRLFGIGPRERAALGSPGKGGIVPGWTWGVLALGAGLVVGVRVYRRWPDKVPSLIAGGG